MQLNVAVFMLFTYTVGITGIQILWVFMSVVTRFAMMMERSGSSLNQ